MSRAGFRVIHFLSKPIAHFIEKATPREITIGWISGMVVGSLVSLSSKELSLVPEVALGGIMGAFLMAAISPSAKQVRRPAGWIGSIRTQRLCATPGEFGQYIFLLDHGLFRVSVKDPELSSAFARLKAGEEPTMGWGLPRTLIPFDDVTSIEYRTQGKDITFTNGTGRRARRQSVSLPNREDRDTLLKEILDAIDSPFETVEREMETSRAIFAPLATSIVFIWLTLVTVWVAACWTASRPLIDPASKGIQDYVDWLTGLGALGVAWRGGLICLAPLAWLFYSYLNPPLLTVLTHRSTLENT